MADEQEKQKQIETASRLQTKWLEHMERLLDSDTITSTDLSTLAKFFMQNGWSVDPQKLPQGLRDKLLKDVEFDEEGNLHLVKSA